MNSTRLTEFSIQRWLEELPDEEIEREMNELNEQIRALSAQYNTLREARDLKQRFRNMYGGETPESRTEIKGTETTTATDEATVTSVTTVSDGSPRPSSISKSVLLLMESVSDKREWGVSDLYGGLVSRGWLTDSPQSSRSLGAALSRMTTDGEIRRVSRGLYAQAAPKTTSPSLLDTEEGASG